MIDTIALTLSEGMFVIADHGKFSPSTIGLYKAPYYSLGGRGTIQCVQNPTKADYLKGLYKPRLTVTKRVKRGGFETVLRIEFSAPKLIYGNNFDELSAEHFASLLTILKERLKEMGVWVRELKIAPVSAIHYSKNIILTDGLTPYAILQELRKANYSQRFDTNQTDFRNEGHSFKYRTNSFEVALYDKLKDLRQTKISPKRAEEPDSLSQLDLFQKIASKIPFEVLRMEVRLNNRTKIKQTMASLGIQVEPTFNALFSEQIAKAVLSKHWKDIEDGYKLIGYKPKDSADLLARLLAANPKITPRKAIQMLGLKVAIDDIGIRQLRIVAANNKNGAWYRLHKEAQQIEWPQSTYSPLQPIRDSLKKFEPVSLSDYQDEVYNVT